VIGTVDNMVSNTPYQNCADSTATSDVNGVVTDYPTAPSPSCASVLVESAKPDPGLTKNVSPTTLYPGETANYVITVSNNPDAIRPSSSSNPAASAARTGRSTRCTTARCASALGSSSTTPAR